MDPITALGVAGQVVQFIQFAFSVLKTCQEIRDDAESATKHNKDLEQATQTALYFRKQLAAVPLAGSRGRITKLAKECTNEAGELLRLLKDVRGEQDRLKGKPLGTPRTLFRALKNKRTIEKQRWSLEEKQKQLDKALIQDTHTTVDDLRTQLERLDISSRANLTVIVDALRDSEIALKDHVDQASVKLEQDIDRKATVRHEDTKKAILTSGQYIDRQAQTRHTNSLRDTRHAEFLKSLAFPDMDQRRDQIEEKAGSPLGTTGQWIFDMEPNDPAHSWVNFERWLRKDDSVYWISGKAASGKSTLIAHIVSDRRTHESLQEWCAGRTLCMPTFYFWKPGSELQKSILGLLRSLLFQICKAFPNTIDKIQSNDNFSKDAKTWTERSLTAAIQKSLTLAGNACYCIFVDGLDEYTGQYDRLVDLIFKLQSSKNVKFCISSRPEVNLRYRLKRCKCLKLEDFNYDDITTVVEDKLDDLLSMPTYVEREVRFLAGRIVDDAQGVFLWAVLVTQSLVKGARSGDDLKTLEKRLYKTPQELSELFAQMVANIDEVHKEQLAFYLQALVISEGMDQYDRPIDICNLTAAQLNGPIASYPAFERACERTQAQILAQSAGLLELHKRTDLWWDKLEWKRSSEYFLTPALVHESRAQDAETARECCHLPLNRPKLLDFEQIVPEWIHRSAYDFVLSSDALLRADKRDNVALKLSEGAGKYICAAPSFHCGSIQMTLTWKRICNIIEWLGDALYMEFPHVHRCIERVNSVIDSLAMDELRGSSVKEFCLPQAEVFSKTMAKLEVVSVARLWAWTTPLLGDLVAASGGRVAVAVYLSHTTPLISHERGLLEPSKEQSLLQFVDVFSGVLQTACNQLDSLSEDEVVGSRADRSIYHGAAMRLGKADSISVSCNITSWSGCAVEPHLLPILNVALGCTLIDWVLNIREYRKWAKEELPHQEEVDTWIGRVNNSLHRLLFRWDFAVAVRGFHRKTNRLQLQAPAQFWLSLVGDSSSHEPNHHAQTIQSKLVDQLKIFCMPSVRFEAGHVEVKDAFELVLRHETLHALCHAIHDDCFSRYVSTRRETKEASSTWRVHLDALVHDIWENEQGLTSTQQLFALACVRTGLQTYIEPYSPLLTPRN